MNSETLMKLIVTRRSVRKFTNTLPCKENILKLIEAASFAPSGTNLQPWQFIIVKNEQKKSEMADVIESYLRNLVNEIEKEESPQIFKTYLNNYTFFKDAPVVIAVLYKPYPQVITKMIERKNINSDSGIERITFGDIIAIQSVSAAIQNMLLMAHSLGMAGCWMTNPLIAKAELEKLLSVKSPYKLLALIPIGFPIQEYPSPRRKKLNLITKVI